MRDTIVITNVDSLLGYAIAYHFLKLWNRSQSNARLTEFRLVCKDKQGLEDLVRLGGKVIQVQRYDDIDAIREIMQGVYYVMFIPDSDKHSAETGKVVIQAAKQQNVEYLAMFSYLGVESLQQKETNSFPYLTQYHQLEQQVEQSFGRENYCIFRAPLWHQTFYYFGPMIDDRQAIMLPVAKDKKWQTIDLGDLVDAVYNLSAGEDKSSMCFSQLLVSNLRKENQTVFELTLPDNFTSSELAASAGQGLQRHSLKFEQTKAEDVVQYLERIHRDNRFKERPTVVPSSDRDHPSTFPLGQYLHKGVIKTLIEWWQLIDEGYSIKPTDQLERAINKKPRSIRAFFEVNRDQFRRLR
ncbi:hypothetical protein A0J61_10136 [Choanephora cucurbitarum]|uniref:NAD(P)-binding domain-containing protein n=1 Tax=Choanephora cucurbitarum TaxID=101091 RepID=A0A1C7MY70_9FUNG|nr:hypothetical protein A0J61_10136 [Choanephora cucurbitarum]